MAISDPYNNSENFSHKLIFGHGVAAIAQALPFVFVNNIIGLQVTQFVDIAIVVMDIVAMMACALVRPWNRFLIGWARSFGIFLLLFIPACLGAWGLAYARHAV